MSQASTPLDRLPRECPICGEASFADFLESPSTWSCSNCGHIPWFRKRTVGEVAVIDAISGRVFLSQDIEGIASVLIRDGNAQDVVINLADVELVTSSFIAGLVALRKRIYAANGNMVVCGLNLVVRETLRNAKVDTLLTIAENEQEAVACLRRNQGSEE
jgi:anti-anti-sigma regulatory factor/ribosomal protein S27AE